VYSLGRVCLADASGEDWRHLDLDAQDAYYERAKESLT
jgi:hypothetical protein